jgi:hypothetical protein
MAVDYIAEIDAILLTSEHRDQKYRLPRPVEVAARIRELLQGWLASTVEVDQAADFIILFGDETGSRS